MDGQKFILEIQENLKRILLKKRLSLQIGFEINSTLYIVIPLLHVFTPLLFPSRAWP